MSHRCTNAFLFNDKIYAGGLQVDDDDPILSTHSAHFAKVEDLRPGGETATHGPGETRSPSPAADQEDADLAAWLAAESQYEEDVQAWLLAEEQYHSDVVAWLTAEGEAKASKPARGRSATTKG